MRSATTALVIFLIAAVAAAQTPVFHTGVSEVAVDLVVTGPHGRIIKNLQRNQIELFDNGHRRPVTSFRLVSRSVHLPSATLRRMHIPAALRPRPFNLVIFLFGNITSQGRQLAARSATWFLQHQMDPGDYGAVFTSGAGLRALTPLTQDRAVLERAVRLASGGASAPRQDVLTAKKQLENDLGGPSQAMAPAERTNRERSGPPEGGPAAAAIAAALRLIIAHATSAANAESSWSSLDALRALVRALGFLPGRKAVIFYGQWLDVNPTTVFMFRAVMHDANRDHVSFYPVDPAGLSVTSSASQVTAALQEAVGNSGTPPAFTSVPGEAVENITYAGHLSALSELAGATGGFLSARSNNLRPFLARIADDIHDHYELTYNPGPLTGGAFHHITIKLPGHSNWRVRARKGYYVLPRLPQPVPDGMTPLLIALAAQPPPDALTLTAAAFAFPASATESDVSLVAQAPFADLTALEPSAAEVKKNPNLRGRQLVNFAMLETAQGAGGQTLDDAAKRFGYALPSAAMATAWAPPWTQTFRLPPGPYTLQSVLYQEQTKKAAVVSRRVVVPPAGPVRLGTVAMVSGVQPAPAAGDAASDPWLYQHYQIIPSLTGALAASSDPRRTLGFYFIAHVPPGAAANGRGPRPGLRPGIPLGATVRMRFARGGRVFLRTPPSPLPAPDAAGQIRFLANLPLHLFPPGVYSATVQVQASAGTASSTVQFRIAP